MRSYFWALMLTMLPAATAAEQLLTKPDKPAEDRPADAKPAGAGDAAKRDAAGPPPNAMFTVIDADGDGVITKVELRKAIVALKTLDSDGDGKITLAEASAGAAPTGLLGDASQFLDRLMQNDKDGDGKLSPEEVPPQMLPMLQNADKNGDRVLDRTELAAAAEEMKQFRGGPGAFGPRGGGQGADPTTGRFLRHDRNGDGRLSLDEVPPQMRNMFQRQDDLNGDGALDAAELQVVIARMGGRARGAGFNPDDARTPGRDIEARARKREQN